MKQGIAFILMMSFATLAYAQNVPNKVEAQDVKNTISTMLADVDAAKKDPLSLNRAIKALSDQLLNNWNAKVYVSPETTRNVTKRLIAIFQAINDEGTNQANKLRIIETICFSDNSPEAHDFVLSLMDTGTTKQKDMVLRSLRPVGVRGDDVYKKIKELVQRGVLKEEDSFIALRRVDSKKALPEIQKFLANTKTVESFVKVGIVLSDYQDPGLLDVLVERQTEFKTEPPKTAQAAINVMEPADAIGSKDLKKYIEIREGDKVKRALAILRKKGTSGDKDLPLFEKKLTTGQQATKEALLDFFDAQVDDGNYSAEKVGLILKQAQLKEANPAIKARIVKMADKLAKKNVR